MAVYYRILSPTKSNPVANIDEGQTTSQADILALIGRIEAQQKKRAMLALEEWEDLAPFGHRSANVKRAEASYYIARKSGLRSVGDEKPPSDRIIDEEIAQISAGGQDRTTYFVDALLRHELDWHQPDASSDGLAEARDQQQATAYQVAILDAELEAMRAQLSCALVFLQKSTAP